MDPKYNVIVSEKFREKLNKLPKSIKNIARKKIETLENKLIGDPLKGDLSGYYSIHFHRNKYRIIYFKDNNEINVILLHVGKRTDRFYDDFRRKIN